MTNLKRYLPIVLTLVATAACEQSKSRNPLSPSIAGPIAGVEITTPVLLEPQAGQKFKANQQPVTLLIENPTSNSERPFTLFVEVAADAGFTSTVFSKQNLEPGTTNGRTAVQLPPDLPTGKTYYWRVQALDGANSSNFSAAMPFEIQEPIVIGTATPVSPVGGGRITTRRPTLTAENATSSGPHGPLMYVFEMSLDGTFLSEVATDQRAPGAGLTSLTIPVDLPYDTLFFWRVRATDGENSGNWSPAASFRTPLLVPSGNSCATNDGDLLVKCIEKKYPSYLVAGVSYSQREANMEFLRDRIIEEGICGGMDLAWNLKRGVGPRSIDALAWRTGGRVEVVDIGAAFDDTSQTLRLQWGIVGGPPGYDPYSPRPTCGG